jgi:hypothetical protein
MFEAWILLAARNEQQIDIALYSIVLVRSTYRFDIKKGAQQQVERTGHCLVEYHTVQSCK